MFCNSYVYLLCTLDDIESVYVVVSHHFGFGIMDASAMVDLARTWTTVPSQHRCEIKSRLSSK